MLKTFALPFCPRRLLGIALYQMSMCLGREGARVKFVFAGRQILRAARPPQWPIVTITYGDGAGGCKGLRRVAKTLILTAVSSGITVDTTAL
jgi:hypothetical protein